MAGAREVPFYDRHGEHRLTLQIEFDEQDQPPQTAEITGPDESGKIMQSLYRREHRPEAEDQWAYIEVSRIPPPRPPSPGSSEALARVLKSEEWPG